MLGKKTRLLDVQVTRLLIGGRRISPIVVGLLNIVDGESAAQALSEIHSRTECPSVSSDPVAPNLDHWQNKVLSYIAASEDLASGMVIGLETLARLIVAKQVSLVEKLSLDRVRAELEELVGDVSGGMEADVSVVARDINTVRSMDQDGDTAPFAPEESNGDALLGFDAPRSVELNTPLMQEVDTNIVPEDIFTGGMDQGDDIILSTPEEIDTGAPLDLSVARLAESAAPPAQEVPVELIGQTRVFPIQTSVIMMNPNKPVGHVMNMGVSIEDVDDVAPYPSDNVGDMATPGYGSEGVGQDGFFPQSPAPQERFTSSEVRFDSHPLLPDSLVEVPQHGFVVEVEEPGSGIYVDQSQQEELLTRTSVFLNSFEDVQESGMPYVYESPGVPALASFGEGHPQDVQARRNPDRTVRRLFPQGGHDLPPVAPVAPRVSANQSAAGSRQRSRKKFGSRFPEEDWPQMRDILDSCEFPNKHRFQTCGECDPCTRTSCTPATESKCRACAKKWSNGGVGRSRHACERRAGCSDWTLKRCSGCHWEES